MGLFRALIAGLIGGVVGASIWAGVAYFTHYEIGFIAWGVGVLVGLGVRIGAGPEDGWTPGILAAAIALCSIVAGKYAVASLVTTQVLSGMASRVVGDTENPEERAISALANEVAREHVRAGRAIEWPPGVTGWEEAVYESDYPWQIWREAETRWDQTPACYRQAAMTTAPMASEERRISYMGHLICQESGGYGAHQWPDGVDPEYAFSRDEFPEPLWASASERYGRMDDAGHAQFAAWASDWISRKIDMEMAAASQAGTSAVFNSLFSPMDILWFGLAVVSAFKLGSGMASNA